MELYDVMRTTGAVRAIQVRTLTPAEIKAAEEKN